MLGTRVKKRREQLGMTQTELAIKLDYKSRSSINKIESGESDIPQSKVQAFADALNTTPAYLMGLDEIEKDYEFSTNLIDTYYAGILHWSEDKLLKENEISIIRGHVSDTFLRYKKLIEEYVYTQRKWDYEKENFSKFYKEKDNPLSDEEIKKLYLEQELGSEIKDLTNWINDLPSWIAHEETRYNKLEEDKLTKLKQNEDNSNNNN